MSGTKFHTDTEQRAILYFCIRKEASSDNFMQANDKWDLVIDNNFFTILQSTILKWQTSYEFEY